MTRLPLSLVFIFLCCCCTQAVPEWNMEWTWVSGTKNVNNFGYALFLTSSPDFLPGTRYGSMGWYDSELREFWIFGQGI